MAFANDFWKNSSKPASGDSIKGSLRKINNLLASQYPTGVSELSPQTAATGTNWVQLASTAGTVQVAGDNGTGTSLTFRRHGLTTTFTFASGARITLPCLANASEWEVQRTDTSNTQVTAKLLAYTTS